MKPMLPSSLCKTLVVLPALMIFGAPPKRALAQAPVAASTASPLVSLRDLSQLVGGPTLVTLQGQKVNVSDAAQTLFDAANYGNFPEMAIEPTKVARSIALDWKDVPFWQAMRDLEDRAGITWIANWRTRLVPVPESSTDFDGSNGVLVGDDPLIKVAWIGMGRSSSGKAHFPAAQYDLWHPPSIAYLQFAVYFDPKLVVYPDAVRLVGLHSGPTLFPPPFGQSFQNDHGNINANGPESRLSIGLPESVKSGQEITDLDGVVEADIITATKTLQVADIEKAAPSHLTAAGVDYGFEGAELKDSQLKLRLSALPIQDAVKTTASAAGGMPIMMRVLDSQGREVWSGTKTYNADMIVEGKRKLATEVTFNLALLGALRPKGPFSLEWQLPDQIRTVTVPFHIPKLKIL